MFKCFWVGAQKNTILRWFMANNYGLKLQTRSAYLSRMMICIAKVFYFCLFSVQGNWDVWTKITTITICSQILIDYLSHSSTFFKKIHKIFQQRMLPCIHMIYGQKSCNYSQLFHFLQFATSIWKLEHGQQQLLDASRWFSLKKISAT